MTDHLKKALAELVALKDMKDEEARLRQRRPVRDQEKIARCNAMRDEYNRRKPAAWAAARAALATPAPASPCASPAEAPAEPWANKAIPRMSVDEMAAMLYPQPVAPAGQAAAGVQEAHPVAGWKLVPIEPTPEMVTAVMQCVRPGTATEMANTVWQAMLAAAPSHPVAAAGVQGEATGRRFDLKILADQFKDAPPSVETSGRQSQPRGPVCPHCNQPDAAWAPNDLRNGRRFVSGVLEYHCHTAAD